VSKHVECLEGSCDAVMVPMGMVFAISLTTLESDLAEKKWTKT